MTKITQEQYAKIKGVLPVQRGNVQVSHIDFLNAILHAAESGCTWRQLPKEYGDWHTIYVRMQRWMDKGVWPRVQAMLQSECDLPFDVAILLRGSTGVDESPDKHTVPNTTIPPSLMETAIIEPIASRPPQGWTADDWERRASMWIRENSDKRHRGNCPRST